MGGDDVLEADLVSEDVAKSVEAGNSGVAGSGAGDTAVRVLLGGLATGALVLDEDVRCLRLPTCHLLLPLQHPLLRLRLLLLPPALQPLSFKTLWLEGSSSTRSRADQIYELPDSNSNTKSSTRTKLSPNSKFD